MQKKLIILISLFLFFALINESISARKTIIGKWKFVGEDCDNRGKCRKKLSGKKRLTLKRNRKGKWNNQKIKYKRKKKKIKIKLKKTKKIIMVFRIKRLTKNMMIIKMKNGKKYKLKRIK